MHNEKCIILHSALCIRVFYGGHEGTRTPNFLLVREAVYQLTYVPENFCPSILHACPHRFQKTSLDFEKCANSHPTKPLQPLSSMAITALRQAVEDKIVDRREQRGTRADTFKVFRCRGMSVSGEFARHLDAVGIRISGFTR